MSTYADQYADKMVQVLTLKDRQEVRKLEIQANTPNTTEVLLASREHVLNGRYASDPILRDLQVQIDRAVQEAIMFGMGALITNTAYVAGRSRGPAPSD